jgi:hypothetical protein
MEQPMPAAGWWELERVKALGQGVLERELELLPTK